MASNHPQTINYNGHETYLANDLKTVHPSVFRGVRSVKGIVTKHNIPDDQHFVVKYIKKTDSYEESNLTYSRSKILIKKDWFDQFIETPEAANPGEPRDAPPILELTDEEKFTDDDGNVYEVEVRGERHEDKIRFKGEDVARVFEMENLRQNVQLSHTEYNEGEDYEILHVLDDRMYIHLRVESRGHKKRLYFTYQGLIKVITKSRSGTAHHFMNWMKRILFKAHLGTDEDKAVLAYELAATNPDVIKAILSKCMSKMSCVYLFNVGKITELRKYEDQLKPFRKGCLYKIGRTDDLFRRTGEHCGTYGKMTGNDLKLQCFSPVDHRDEVSAEGEIRRFFSETGPYGRSMFCKLGKFDELIVLDKSEVSEAKKFYSQMYTKYGSYIQKYLQENQELRININGQKLLLESKDKVIAEMNHHISSMKRELDTAYASIQYFKEQISEGLDRERGYQEREHGYQEREHGYRAQLSQKDELIKDITRKLANYSRQLQENPGDPTISEKIGKYRRKVMRLAGINEGELVDQMENMRI